MRKCLAAACGAAGQLAPAASHDDELFAISCALKKGCLAGGKWFNSKAKSTEALAETSAGGS